MRRWPVCGAVAALLASSSVPCVARQTQDRPRIRDLGIEIGQLPPGSNNAITDVDGVLVGHATVVEGDSIRTGVTAILPHRGDVFAAKVPAAIFVANGFGKLAGVTQVAELGTIETPIVLTNTLAVGRVVDAVVRWTMANTADSMVRSINAVVGETNDGYLNAIRVPRVGRAEVEAALSAASGGVVEEGSVGAGTGTRALGFKGGIGTASRRIRIGEHTYTLGALVQSNFGGALEIRGVSVGRQLGAAAFIDRWIPERGDEASRATPTVAFDIDGEPDAGGGSIMIVIATDAPLAAAALARVARRATYAIGRVGGFSAHGSGDYVIAFSTHDGVRMRDGKGTIETRVLLRAEALSPLFLAAMEATEEAILNSLFRATTVSGHRGKADAIPVEPVVAILEAAGIIEGDP